jgi:hypothetical protein
VLTAPYVSVKEFRAAPTFLDSENLRTGQSPDYQDAELFNVLLRASAWADNFVSAGGFAAHTRTDQLRARSDRYGRLRLNPDHIPVTAVSSLAYGATMSNLTTLTSPTVWIEDERQVVAELAGVSTWSGALQFGAPTSGDLFVRWTYTAGYATTNLAASTSAGATSITVGDATGITAGTVLRLWDPGKEEAVIVGSSYAAGSTTVPLAEAMTYAHAVTAGAGGAIGASALPADVHQSIINYAVALLMRPDTTAEDQYPSTTVTSTTRRDDPRRDDASGLVTEAKRILRSYRRAR